MAVNTAGNPKSRSDNRMMASSANLPKRAAASPSRTPTLKPMATVTNPTMIELIAPVITLDMVSRPYWSVPSG